MIFTKTSLAQHPVDYPSKALVTKIEAVGINSFPWTNLVNGGLWAGSNVDFIGSYTAVPWANVNAGANIR